MSACREFRDQLSAHVDGALEPRERTALEVHLAGCGACREALEDLRRTVARIRSLEPVEPPPWLAERILARVGRPPGRLRLLAARPQLQAAALVLICFTGLLVLKVAGPRRTVAPPVLEPAVPPVPGPVPPPAPKPEPRAVPPRFAQPPPKAAPTVTEAAPEAPEPPPAPAGAASGYGRVMERGAGLDTAMSKARARQGAAGSLAELAARPTVTFRLETGGDLEEAVKEALVQSRAAVSSSGAHRAVAQMAAEDLPALRAALKRLGPVAETGPRELPPNVLVQVSW